MELMQMMQMQRNNFQVKTDNSASADVKNTKINQPAEKFGSVFNKVVAGQQKPTQNTESKSTQETDEQLVNILTANSLQEVFEALDIPLDEATLTVNVDDKEIPVDQLLTTDNLAALLGMDLEDLQSLLEQFTNGEMDSMDSVDIWSILEQAPQLLTNLVESLEGKQTVSEDTTKLAQFLKLAQLVGEKTDTIYQQQFTLESLKQSLDAATVQISNLVQPVQPNNANTLQLNQIQQYIQPVQTEQKVEATSQTAQSNNESFFQQNAQSNSTTRLVTVTLPLNPASQAEALAKEIQNLITRSQLSNNQGTMKLMLKLFPENLGQIRIEIMQQNGVMTARLLATTAAGKELLDSNLNQLKATFVSQNIQMERIDVTQALQETDKNFRDQSFFSNFFKQQPEEETDEENGVEEEEQISFSDLLNEEVQQ